jgi:hypothetical protein
LVKTLIEKIILYNLVELSLQEECLVHRPLLHRFLIHVPAGKGLKVVCSQITKGKGDPVTNKILWLTSTVDQQEEKSVKV